MSEKKDNREIIRLLELEVKFLYKIRCELHELSRFFEHQNVTSFKITQQGATMAITGIAPGGTGTFTATPLNSGGTPVSLPAAMIATWSSDAPLAVVTPSATDPLTCNLVLDPSITGGTVINLAIAATNADGTPASGSAPVPVLSVTVDVASFAINQTA